MTAAFDVLDDFAGPGGWDLGARMIGLTTVGIERDMVACQTAKTAGFARIRADVATYPSAPFAGIPGYVASPPCPDFSTAGQGRGETGPGGRYVRIPLRRVLELRPEWTAWEQVAPVLPIWRECAYELRCVGYDVWTGILDASRYGIGQARRRAVLMASCARRVTPPTATHGPGLHGLFGAVEPLVTLADVLGLEPGWWYDSGQNSVLADGRIARYRRSCDRPAGTITSKAAGQWVLSRGRDRRKVNLLEAAHIQGFPPDYPWQGSAGDRARQIGDAIPPLLAAHILGSLTGRSELLTARDLGACLAQTLGGEA